MSMATAASKTTKVFAQQARGSRERFFRFTLLYYYVNVTFSFTLRYRSGRNVFVYVQSYVTVAGVKRSSRLRDPGRHFPVPYYLVTQ